MSARPAVHVHERHVSHSDTDADGVVHFSRYLVYCEDALFSWFRKLGLDLGLPGSERTVAITSLQIAYRRPLHFGRRCEVTLTVAARRRYSLRLDVVVRADGEIHAEGWFEAAFLHREGWRLAGLPETLADEPALATVEAAAP
jgi:YbgC/YbaW family acyl-CoA thioester hydrolase